MSAPRIAVACLLAALGGTTARGDAAQDRGAPPKEVRRALWITRWDWQGESGLRETIARAADAGFDTLLFQVRGAASAFWSDLEPRAEELAGGTLRSIRSPCTRSRTHSVALHAWSTSCRLVGDDAAA